jgi:hypothetical protein
VNVSSSPNYACDHTESRQRRGAYTVENSSRNALGREVWENWRSEERGTQPREMSCGMCYTDFGMVVEEAVQHGQVRVTI